MTIQLVTTYHEPDGDHGYVLATDSGGLVFDSEDWNGEISQCIPIMFVQKCIYGAATLGIFSGARRIKGATPEERLRSITNPVVDLAGVFDDIENGKFYAAHPSFRDTPMSRIFIAKSYQDLSLFYLGHDFTQLRQADPEFWRTSGKAEEIHRFPSDSQGEDPFTLTWYAADNTERVIPFVDRGRRTLSDVCNGASRLLTDSPYSTEVFESLGIPNPFKEKGAPKRYEESLFRELGLPIPEQGQANQSLGPLLYVVGRDRFGLAHTIGQEDYLIEEDAEWDASAEDLEKFLLRSLLF